MDGRRKTGSGRDDVFAGGARREDDVDGVRASAPSVVTMGHERGVDVDVDGKRARDEGV